jgi:hypothetical protein
MLLAYICIPLINFRNPELVSLKLCMYIMEREPISTAYFINPFIGLCVYMCILLFVAWQRLGNRFQAATNTQQ